MHKYVDFLQKFKYHLIIGITLLVALFSIALTKIAYEGSYRIWFDASSKQIKAYDHFRSTFSGDDRFAVAFEDKEGIFTAKAVDTILELSKAFKKIDGVQKVDSLANYQYVSSDGDDVLIENFLYDSNDLEAKKKLALQEKLIVHQFLSPDAKTTMLSVQLSSRVSADEEVNLYVMEKIEAILAEASTRSGYRFYLTGVPAVTASLVSISKRDAMILTPLAVVIVVALLFLLFRNIMGILIPSVVIVFSFLIVLSVQILLGYKLNNFTVNIPSFISSIAIADTIHLYLAWIFYKQKGKKGTQAVALALQNNMLPIALTSFTTALGFATLGMSEIEPISTLGIAITSGAVIAFVLSVTLAPAILLLLPEAYPVREVKLFNLANVTGYGAFIRRNDKKIILSFVAVLLVMLYGLQFLKVDSNSIKYFSENTTVRTGSTFLEKKLTGAMVYEVILNAGQKEGIKNPKFLETIVRFEKELKARYSNIRFSSSLKDIVTRMQAVLSPEIKEEIPSRQNLVAQYLLFYTMSLPQGMEINDRIDTSEQYLRLSLNSNIQETSKDLEMIDWIEAWWKTHQYAATVEGQAKLFAHMQHDVTDTLVTSISVTVIIVAIMMFLIFRNLRMLWIFIIPNVLPILFVLGVMGYLGLTIDIGVAISAAVILGILVDDTIHFFSHYLSVIKGKSFEESIDDVIRHSGHAIVLTTFILSLTFSIFLLSDFVPNINFAIVTVITLNIALVLDLVLLPALLSFFFYKKPTVAN